MNFEWILKNWTCMDSPKFRFSFRFSEAPKATGAPGEPWEGFQVFERLRARILEVLLGPLGKLFGTLGPCSPRRSRHALQEASDRTYLITPDTQFLKS